MDEQKLIDHNRMMLLCIAGTLIEESEENKDTNPLAKNDYDFGVFMQYFIQSQKSVGEVLASYSRDEIRSILNALTIHHSFFCLLESAVIQYLNMKTRSN